MNWPQIVEFITVLISVFVIDILWTLWFIATEDRHSIKAAFWSALIISMSAYNTRHFVDNNMSIVAGTIGAFLGTLCVVEWKSREKENMNKIKQALLFAKEKHLGQKYGSHDYMYHLIRVVKVAQRYGASDKDIIACFLHDTIEDTPTTHKEISDLFGSDVADVVDLVSNRSSKEMTFKRIRSNKHAVFVKLCDRIANCEEGAKNDKYKKEYPLFKQILYKPGEFESMWKHLDSILL